jgi:hypothetical protein
MRFVKAATRRGNRIGVPEASGDEPNGTVSLASSAEALDVVVVGLGPGGSTAALALASQRIRVHAVSMFPWVANSRLRDHYRRTADLVLETRLILHEGEGA